MKGRTEWSRSALRAELLAVYAQADALLEGWSCECAGPMRGPHCCHFVVTGREPMPTAVELQEVRHALRTTGVTPREPRRLPFADQRPCPLLSDDGRCRIYASRPFGCRTFFCNHAQASAGARLPRRALNELGRRVAELSARFDPQDPRPRSLATALGHPAR